MRPACTRCPCWYSVAACASARASVSARTPKSRRSGGAPVRGFVTAPVVAVVLSPRVCRSVTPTVPATAAAAASATTVRTHGREGSGEGPARSDTAIFRKVMPSYRELLQQVKAEIEEVDAPGALELLESADPPLFIDVREPDEWNDGHIPGAVHVSRGNFESRIEQAAPDRARPIVVYCAAGARSAFSAKTLEELGYEHVADRK